MWSSGKLDSDEDSFLPGTVCHSPYRRDFCLGSMLTERLQALRHSASAQGAAGPRGSRSVRGDRTMTSRSAGSVEARAGRLRRIRRDADPGTSAPADRLAPWTSVTVGHCRRGVRSPITCLTSRDGRPVVHIFLAKPAHYTAKSTVAAVGHDKLPTVVHRARHVVVHQRPETVAGVKVMPFFTSSDRPLPLFAPLRAVFE